jgi:chitodextrinase
MKFIIEPLNGVRQQSVTVWDAEKGKELCTFIDGEYETNDKYIIDKLIPLGYKSDEEEANDEEVIESALRAKAKELGIKSYHLEKEKSVETQKVKEKEIASLVIVKSDPSFSGTGNVTHTFTKYMFAFAINNKGTSSLTFTIDGSTVTVGAGEAFSENFEPFTEVSIVASGAWEAYGLTYPVISVVVIPEPPPDVTPPNDATNLVVSNLAATSLTLGWTASTSSDIALYDVYKGSTLLGTVAGLTCNVTGLTASTTYTFTVKAKDASNNISAGVSVNTTTSAASTDTTAPGNVTNLTTASVTQTTLTLNWTASTDNVAVTGYDVFNGSTFLATVTGVTYNVTGLTASTAYTFTVKARDAAGNLATGTSVGVTTSAPADTTAPVLTITPAAGTYTTTQTVSMSATDSGSTPTIYYTLDGSTPTTSSTVYSVPISVSATTTVKAFARDAAGNNSAVQTVVYTINLSSSTVSDAFNRANDTTSLGIADTGQTWQVLAGTGGIISNQAYFPVIPGNEQALAAIDSLTSNGTVQLKLGSAIGTPRIAFRIKAADQYFCFQPGGTGYTGYRFNLGGGFTKMGDTTGVTHASGNILKVVMLGSNFKFYVNDVLGFEFNDTSYSTETRYGFGADSNACRFDDYVFTP